MFDIPNIKKWKFDQADPTQKWDNWYAIKQNGYKKSCNDLGLTMPNSKMTIVFLFFCQAGLTEWRNIFHFTNSGKNCCEKGDRIPAMWIFPDGTNNYHIRFSTENNQNDGYNYEVARPRNIPELVTLVFDDNTFTLYINDRLIHTGTYNNIAKREPYGSFYIGDEWHVADNNLFIKNFTLYDGALTAKNISDIYTGIGKGAIGRTGAAPGAVGESGPAESVWKYQ